MKISEMKMALIMGSGWKVFIGATRDECSRVSFSFRFRSTWVAFSQPYLRAPGHTRNVIYVYDNSDNCRDRTIVVGFINLSRSLLPNSKPRLISSLWCERNGFRSQQRGSDCPDYPCRWVLCHFFRHHLLWSAINWIDDPPIFDG